MFSTIWTLIEYLLFIFFKIYIIAVLATFAILAIMYALTKVKDEKHKFTYKMKFILVYFAVIMGVGLTGIPWFLLRPKDSRNVIIAGWVVRKFAYLLGITFEIRGANILSEERAAVCCINHQSSLDIFAMLSLWNVAGKMTAISKKEILYVFPFGPASYLAGIEFIDRSNPKKSYQQLDDVSDRMRRENCKLAIFPEGTRNKERGFLPFKKGAFKTAIKAHFPIIPIVFCPYHFVDTKNKTFEKGHMVIEVLEPISTVGMTDDDLDKLVTTVRDKMYAVYQRLSNEVDDKSKNENWRNKPRQRMTLINK